MPGRQTDDRTMLNVNGIYISDDGNWGDAASLHIIDATMFDDNDWEYILEALEMYGPITALRRIREINEKNNRWA